MVNSTSNIDEFKWTDDQCRMGLLAAEACLDMSNFNVSEANSLAEDPSFLPGRVRRTCEELLPPIFDSSRGARSFGQAGCDAQILVFTTYASKMRQADRTANAETPLNKYVEALFRLEWSYAQFCQFMRIPNIDQL